MPAFAEVLKPPGEVPCGLTVPARGFLVMAIHQRYMGQGGEAGAGKDPWKRREGGRERKRNTHSSDYSRASFPRQNDKATE